MKFPIKTLEKMIGLCQCNLLHYGVVNLKDKLQEITKLNNIDKQNRWFGYYQHVGEVLGLWTLEEISQWVRDEKNE